MIKFLRDIFTSQDGVSYSMSKLIGALAALVMVCNFIRTLSVDFQGFGIAMGALITAFAAKAYTDTKP